MHENGKKEVTRALKEVGPDFDRDPVTPKLKRIFTNKDHLSIERVELRLRIQFRGSGVKEGPAGAMSFNEHNTNVDKGNCAVPEGWKREIRKRKSGKTKGKYDIYFYNPDNKMFRSKKALQRYLNEVASKLDLNAFDFTVPKDGESSAEKKMHEEESRNDTYEEKEGHIDSSISSLMVRPNFVSAFSSETNASTTANLVRPMISI
ncbi:methyl-CpG-binding domain protein 4 [Trichonephila inaurata madagascariensis]|uniref:Methyl-CpG-binding domain protein 4 n=1 Tax=Trichonephila inaurata madagascariensis TaxID=2747483 RepID=A0A8X6XDQ1_9ARAC|nr:methyl-CpG-binding domain protein 4 [Trichonephila inaurata madagascariensis]